MAGTELDPTLPQIRCVPAGQGSSEVEAYRSPAYRADQSLRLLFRIVTGALLVVSLYFTLRQDSVTYLLGGFLLVGLSLWLRTQYLTYPAALVPKLLVRQVRERALFVDATALHAGALLGDVRHDPYQSGGVETPPHHLVEAGAIHLWNVTLRGRNLTDANYAITAYGPTQFILGQPISGEIAVNLRF